MARHGGKAGRRFYNRALNAEVYNKCLLATKNRFEALNTIPEEEYVKQTLTTSGGWTQTTYKPPSSTSMTNGLSQAFRQYDPGKTSTSSRKRAKTAQERPTQAQEEANNEEPKRKKRSLFTRSVELKGQMRTYKVLMLPTREQKIELKRCFAVARHAYNYANERIRRAGARTNFIELRNEWTNRPPLPWASEPHTKVATRIQQHAIKQCVDAYVSNYAIQKKKPRHQFEVKYRSLLSTTTETLVIEKDEVTRSKSGVCTRKRFEAINDMPTLPRRSECLLHLGNNLERSGGLRLQDSSKVIALLLAEQTRLKENAKILWEKRLGKFYFIYAYEQPKLEDPDPMFEKKRVVATDPGLSPFQEWYSPTSGEFGVLLDGGRDGKLKRCKVIDALQTRLERRKQAPMVTSERRRECCSWQKQKRLYARTTRRLRKRFQRACSGLRNWMENGHYSAANFLLQKHDVIIQPILHVKELTDTGKRDLNSKGARAMYTWGHYQFRQRLKSVATRYPGRHVYETTEPGTSKTCTHCGFWNPKLKLGDKIFDCPRCCVQVDRQLAGARNNFFAAYGMAIGRGWDGVGG
jgi:transposase